MMATVACRRKSGEADVQSGFLDRWSGKQVAWRCWILRRHAGSLPQIKATCPEWAAFDPAL